MIADVDFQQTTFAELPFKFEAGTPPIAEAIALKESLDFIKEIGFDALQKHESELITYAFNRLNEIDGMEIYGGLANRSGVISFNIKDVYHYDAGVILDQLGIAVRTGHHCAQPLMRHLNIPGTLRCSFACYNTSDEVDALVEGVGKACSMLR